MTQDRKQVGERGEGIALSFLKKNKFKILAKNYTCRYGEIDIIARDRNNILSFIEVKTRTSQSYGAPQEAVHPRKQAQISRVAMEFIQRYNLENYPARFDVIAIELSPAGHAINLIQNAFELTFT
ncbi:MAG: YraN family protein [Proteobacteria bacterium]|nr:YraN family protein [Pseudomonadota bacterium]